MNSIVKDNNFFVFPQWCLVLNEIYLSEKINITSINKKFLIKYGDSSYSYIYKVISSLKQYNFITNKDKLIVLTPKGLVLASMINKFMGEVNKNAKKL